MRKAPGFLTNSPFVPWDVGTDNRCHHASKRGSTCACKVKQLPHAGDAQVLVLELTDISDRDCNQNGWKHVIQRGLAAPGAQGTLGWKIMLLHQHNIISHLSYKIISISTAIVHVHKISTAIVHIHIYTSTAWWRDLFPYLSLVPFLSGVMSR